MLEENNTVLQKLRQDIEKADIICFDCFDTLVSRACYPDYNKKAWSDILGKILGNIDGVTLHEKRVLAEKKLCEKALSENGEAEFSYGNMVDIIYEDIKPDYSKKDFLKLCEHIEVSIEKKVQYVRPGIFEVLNFCKNNNKKILCVSDMYLTKKMMQEIFIHHGILDYFDDILISGDQMASKRSGRMYEIVKDQNKSKKILMIGDNYNVDYEMAIKNGLNAHHLDDEATKQHYSWLESEQYNGEKIINKLALYASTGDNDVYKTEYVLYKFCEKIQIELFKENLGLEAIKNIDSNIFQRMQIYCNESWLMLGEGKKGKITIEQKNNALVLLNNGTEKAKVNFNEKKLNRGVFEQIVCTLSNREVSDDEVKKIFSQTKITTKQYASARKLKKIGTDYSYIFYSFVKWILDDCKKKNIKKIYFFTREGEFFKQAFDLIKDDTIESHILEVSRVATFCPSMANATIEECMRIWNQYSTQSTKAFCKTLNIDVVQILPFLNKYNILLSDDIIYPWNDNRVRKLFGDKEFIDFLSNIIKEKRALILDYFKSRKLENVEQNIAIVDIGWRGTIQDNIAYILNNTAIDGYYFGLIDFLNKQPKNCKKFGFLNQFKGGMKILDSVTPLEMICNSPNGSTIGYSNSPSPHAVRKKDEKENESYYKCTQFIQEGILKDIEKNKEKYSKKTDKELFREMANVIYTPKKAIAKTYFDLKHNEEFGCGDYIYKKKKFHFMWGALGVVSKGYRHKFIQNILSSSWNQGFLAVNNLGFLNRIRKKRFIKKGDETRIMQDENKETKKKIAWFIPMPIAGSGGHRTIIQNANILAENGYECDLYVENDYVTKPGQMTNLLKELFGECKCNVHMGGQTSKEYDLAIATHAVYTPEYVLKCNSKKKAYFIQDFEPWFMPMGDMYLSMEQTYNYGFNGISIGRWLAHKIQTEYQMTVDYFPFCADTNVYKKLKNTKKEKAICFIFQPEKPRRCWQLGIRALKIVKAVRPDIKIYLYGSSEETAIKGLEYENLHIVSPEECNKLYNKCMAGLCISTSNPSRIPFEMMASGLPVVDLYRENNLYDMPSGAISLAEQSPEAIAAALIEIIDNKDKRTKMSEFGVEYMKDYPIEAGFNVFLDLISRIINSKEIQSKNSVEKLYDKEPVVASDETLQYKDLALFQPERPSKKRILLKKGKHLVKSVLRRAKKIIKR